LVEYNLIIFSYYFKASKKRFWVSHLKLAESREIDLNKYVQSILKLPTQVFSIIKLELK